MTRHNTFLNRIALGFYFCFNCADIPVSKQADILTAVCRMLRCRQKFCRSAVNINLLHNKVKSMLAIFQLMTQT